MGSGHPMPMDIALPAKLDELGGFFLSGQFFFAEKSRGSVRENSAVLTARRARWVADVTVGVKTVGTGRAVDRININIME